MGNKNRNQSNSTDKKEDTASSTEASTDSSSEVLLGSNSQPSIVKVAGFEVELGQAVKGAFEKSGLTVAEWNALSQDAREGYIAGVIDAQPEQAGDRGPVDNLDVAQAAGQGVESLNTDLGGTNTTSADPDGVATAAGQDEPIVGDLPDPEGDSEIEAVVVDDPVHPPPSVALVNGVLEDYERVMGAGKQPTEQQGISAQQSLLRMIRVLTGDTREAAGESIAAIQAYFEAHQNDTASESHLARFVSLEDLELLLSVRAYAVK